MQTYYEVGYACALEKLGMPAVLQRIGATAKGVAQKVRGGGGSRATQKSIDAILTGPKQAPVPMAEQARRAGVRAPAADPNLNAGFSPDPRLQVPQNVPPLTRTPAAPAGGKSQAAPSGGKSSKVVESKTKPTQKPAEKPTKGPAAAEQGLLSKYKWPLLGAGAVGAAGLGGYAYLRNRDPMGSSQIPMGQGTPYGAPGGGFNGY